MVKGLLIVERDVPQTRADFVPVINHQAMVVNTSSEAVKLEIASPFSKELHVVTKFYPAFGRESLLGEPMRFPGEVKAGKYEVLEKPAVSSGGKETVFSWREVPLAAGDAVIAQYDQYAGPLAQYYHGGELRVLDLVISTSPKIETRQDSVSVGLRVQVRNQGKEKFENLTFDYFLPDTIHPLEGATDTVLLEDTTARASEGVTYGREDRADGRGRPAAGTLFTYSQAALEAGKQVEIKLEVSGKRTARAEVCHPLLILLGLSRGDRIWPETAVKPSKSLPMQRFYYRQASIILPSPLAFRFASGGVTVETFSPPKKAPRTGAGG